MKAVHSIWSHADRQWLSGVVMDPSKTPPGTRVEFRPAKRTLGQNNRLWGTATSISEQVKWHGATLTPSEWIQLFVARLKKLRIVPNLDGDGFVALGARTSEMSRDELDNLQECIYEFGASVGVTFKEPRAPPADRIVPPRRLSYRARLKALAASREAEF